MFGVFNIAGSGLTAHRTWLDAVADNIANVNDTAKPGEPAYQERFIVAQANETSSSRFRDPNGGASQVGHGVRVVGVELGSAEGRLVYEPTNPNADENGMVRHPDVDLSQQMTNMILAQRGYQANLAVIERARAAYQDAINLGRS